MYIYKYLRGFDELLFPYNIARYVSSNYPKFIDPLHLADKRGELKGQLPVSGLDRLADLLFSDTGLFSVDLFFGRKGGWPKLRHIETVLELKCQNCLQSVQWLSKVVSSWVLLPQ